jgi:cell division transport system ATP-binding protein
VIVFQGVSKHYTGHGVALEDVNFEIDPGEFVSLAGRSGAGKSTIIKLLIGEEKPSKGRVFFGQYEVNKLQDNELPAFRRHIGVVFQDFRLLPTKTAYENVAFALEVAGRPQREIAELVPQVLDMVGLGDKMKNFPHELSGGERQRVARDDPSPGSGDCRRADGESRSIPYVRDRQTVGEDQSAGHHRGARHARQGGH